MSVRWPKTVRRQDVAAIAVAVATFAGSMIAMASPTVDPGIHLAYEDGQVVIASIDYASEAYYAEPMLEPGMVVVNIDGFDVIGAPDSVKQNDPGDYWRWQSVRATARDQIALVLQESPEVRLGMSVDLVRHNRQGDLLPIGLGLSILILGWRWLGTGRASAAIRPFAVTAPVATAVPVMVLPLVRLPTFEATIASSVLIGVAMLLPAMDLSSRLMGRWRQASVVLVAVILAAAAAVLGLLVPMASTQGSYGDYRYPLGRAVLAASVVAVPGLLAAAATWRSKKASGRSTGTLYALVAVTPGVATIGLVPGTQYVLWPIVVWAGALFSIWFIRFSRHADQTALHRDLVVTTTEAERARIAADIHDDALQDLTMLVRRLDAAGDKANAEAAREVAQRLRTLCGDLRLPVLDDLGVGPALDWMCGRMSAIAGSIGLDRVGEESRLPAEVELAFYRVAQEAVSNAATHGAPPIAVRYRSRDGWAELTVDDSGQGIPPGAAERAEKTGHLGLLSMTQRAEAIGAQLSIGRRVGGGTRVSLAWELAAKPPSSVAAAPG